MNILNKKISMEYKMVFCNIKKQAIKLSSNTKLLGSDWIFAGHLSSIEYDLLLEAMFKKYCMHDLDFEIEDCKLMVQRIRKFCDDIKDEFRHIQ
mgnify:FL=1|tara:strand:+ start:474 stop:755 length:282 start_codon:yes stop_codon:yes gene_type:complete